MKHDDDIIPVTMPQLGEGVREGQVRFLKQVGDPVRRDEPVVEVDTDKVTVELTAPLDGVLVSARGDGEAQVGDELYALRPGPAPPRGPAPSPSRRPSPPPSPAPPTPPYAPVVQSVWDASRLQARARRERTADPTRVEAALLWTAALRALIAAPELFGRIADPRAGRVALRHCDVRADGTHWLHAAVDPGDPPEAVLTAQREGPGGDAHLLVVRLHGDVPLMIWPLAPRTRVTLLFGPVTDQPVVERGLVVARPIGTLSASFSPPVRVDEGARLFAVLREQLASL